MLGTGEQLSYDRLVLATGSRPRLLPIEGFGLEGSFTLRGADDAMRLRAYAQHREARRAVIVGGGVLGLEAADAARKLGLEATIVELSDRLSPVQLDEHAARLLQSEVEGRGIEILLGRSVASVASDGERVTGVTLDDGTHRAAELVLVCAGITPNAELAREAGLEVGRGVLVDDTLRTSDEAIYAAGDVAEYAGRLYGHWPAAVEQAEAAAVNAIGGRRHYTGSLIATHLKVTGVELTSIGRPHVEPDDVEIALGDKGSVRYRKLVIADGKIAGAILLGHPSEASAVFAAAREGRDVSAHLDALSTGDWEVLSEPSFEQTDAGTAQLPVTANGGAETNGDGPTNSSAPANGLAPGNGRTPANGDAPANGRTPVAAARPPAGDGEGHAATDPAHEVSGRGLAAPGGAERAGHARERLTQPLRAATKRLSAAGSRRGGPWPKRTSAGSSDASRRADSRLRAGSGVKKPGGSCRPGIPVSG